MVARRNSLSFLPLLFFMLSAGALAAQQGGSLAARSAASLVPPTVVEQPNGVHVLRLNPAQQQAVDDFVHSHPGFHLASYRTLGLDESNAQSGYQQWQQIVREQGATPQYPFAAWGDFNSDGLLDFVLPFFSNRQVNKWGWREWLLVVFEGRQSGTYAPVIAGRDTFGVCFDGMLFHPKRRQLEYWCKSAGGSLKWNGSRYVHQRLKGD
ncbi:MAG: hypothetical protein WB763_00770 [Terriglobia bacterium]|jgi:hypothetical protein